MLVVTVNRLRADGMGMVNAVAKASELRFRPILLTSFTTFLGLAPLIFSGNPATFFIVPMAISLAFGILFATVITLFLTPSLYPILHELICHTDTHVHVSHRLCDAKRRSRPLTLGRVRTRSVRALMSKRESRQLGSFSWPGPKTV